MTTNIIIGFLVVMAIGAVIGVISNDAHDAGWQMRTSSAAVGASWAAIGFTILLIVFVG